MTDMCKEVCRLGKGLCDPSECKIINEQLVDMQLLLQKQEEIIRNLKQTPALSIVMRSLQEKKKEWETRLIEDKNARNFNGTYPNKWEYYDGCTQRDKEIVETLEEIINQNFA